MLIPGHNFLISRLKMTAKEIMRGFPNEEEVRLFDSKLGLERTIIDLLKVATGNYG